MKSGAWLLYAAVLGAGLAWGGAAPQDEAELAFEARDEGRTEEALAHWRSLSQSQGPDAFFLNQLGWSLLSAGKNREAGEAFLKAIDRSSTTAAQAEANLGLGMAALERGEPRDAMPPLRSALVLGPYIMPEASYQTALTALAVGDKPAALAYLRQSLKVDPLGLEALKELARLEERVGEKQAAWRLYQRVLGFEPGDEGASDAVKRLNRFIPNPEAWLAVRRLTKPLLEPAAKPPVEPASSTVTLRVALFTLRDGASATAVRLNFTPNSNFSLIDEGGQAIKDDAPGASAWEIAFRPESGVIEVRDSLHNIQYEARRPFRIAPKARAGSVLISKARFQEASGFDPGDRELRGSLEVRPASAGFKLVNLVELEDYLYGAVGAAMPQASPMEAYKAQAVVARTLALWFKGRNPKADEPDLCDSERCQPYLGVSQEMREATTAVAATDGLILTKEGQPAPVAQHENCGGFTEEDAFLASVADGPRAASAPRTRAELERWTHESPPADRFCAAESADSPASSRWVRVLQAKEVEKRASRIKAIGGLKGLKVLRRSPTGRVLALEVQGSQASLALEGEDAISDVLSPGSLRSMLFTIQPLGGRGAPGRFILWGAGQGHGRGLCRAGAVGQATQGRDFKTILAAYFPAFKLERP